MVINCFQYLGFFCGTKLRPSYFNLFLTIFFNPYLSNSITAMRFLAASPNYMDMPSVFHCIGREYG